MDQPGMSAGYLMMPQAVLMASAGYDLMDQAAYTQMAQQDYIAQYAGSQAASAVQDQMDQAAYAQVAQQAYMSQYTGSQAFQGVEEQADGQAWGLHGGQWATHEAQQQAGIGSHAPDGQAAAPGHQQPPQLGQWAPPSSPGYGRTQQGHLAWGGVSSATWAGQATAEHGAAEGAESKRPRKVLAITDPNSAAPVLAPALAGGGATSTTWAGPAAVPPGAAEGAAVTRPRKVLAITHPNSATGPVLAPASEPGGKAGRQAAAASTRTGQVAVPAAGREAGPSAEAHRSAAAEPAAGRRAADETEAGVSAQALQESAPAADSAAARQAGAMAEAEAKPAADPEATAAAEADARAWPTAARDSGTGGQAASKAEARPRAVTRSAVGAQSQPAGAGKTQFAARTAGAGGDALAGEVPAATADKPRTQLSRPAVECPSAEEARVMMMTAALQRLEVTFEEGKPEALAKALAAARAFPELQADCASAQQLLELLQPIGAAAAGKGTVPNGRPPSQADNAATNMANGKGSSRHKGAGADSAAAAAAVMDAGDASGYAGARHSAMAAQDMPRPGSQEPDLPLDARIRQAVAASTVWDGVDVSSAPRQAVTAETVAGDGSHRGGTQARAWDPSAAAALPAAAQLDAVAMQTSAGRAGAGPPRPAPPPGFPRAAGQSREPQQPRPCAPGALPAATAGLQAAGQPSGPAALQREPAVAGGHGAEQSHQAGTPRGGKQMPDVQAKVEALWESKEPAAEALQPVEAVEGEVATNFTDFLAMLLPKEAAPEQLASHAGSRVQPSSPQPLDLSAWLPEASAQAGSPQPEQQQDEALPGLGGGVRWKPVPPTAAGSLPGPIAAALGRMGVEAPKPTKGAKPQPTMGSERVGLGRSLGGPGAGETWGPAPANPAQQWPPREHQEGQQQVRRWRELPGAGTGDEARPWADMLGQERRQVSRYNSGALFDDQSAGTLSGDPFGKLSGQSSSDTLFPPVGAASEAPPLPGPGRPARQLDSNNAWARKLTVPKPDPSMSHSVHVPVPAPASSHGPAGPPPSEPPRMKMNRAAAASTGPAGGTGRQGSTGPPAAGSGEVRVLEVPMHWMNYNDSPAQKKGGSSFQPPPKPPPKPRQPAPPAPEVTKLEVSDLLAKQNKQHKGKGLEDVMARVLTGQDTSDISDEAWDDLLSCPISQERMKDPVVAADGHSYERYWIAKWLENNDTSPMTGVALEHKVLIPNQLLKDLVQRY